MAFVKFHQPCNDCGSSDAVGVNDDNSAWCFSCNKHFKNYGTAEVQQPDTITDFEVYQRNNKMEQSSSHYSTEPASFNELTDRKISLATAKKFGVK